MPSSHGKDNPKKVEQHLEGTQMFYEMNLPYDSSTFVGTGNFVSS